jgi:hypothetical protein
MVVPTEKLFKLLELRKVTTNVEPLVLLPIQRRSSQPETSRQRQYTRAFKAAITTEMSRFLCVPAALLQLWEMGSVHHSRTSGGRLVWSNAKEVDETGNHEQAVVGNDTSGGGYPVMQRVVVEIFGMNILLVRDDDLSISDGLLQLFELSHVELQAMFAAVAGLLSRTSPDDRMHAYAIRPPSGGWVVDVPGLESVWLTTG